MYVYIYNARDTGLIPGSGISPRVGNSNLFQYSCLENSMDRGAWRAIVHGVAKSWTWLSTHIHPLHGSQSCRGEGACIANEAMSHAVRGCLRLMSHSEDFWRNMVHWRKECKSLQYSCHENPMNCMKRQKGMTPEDEPHRSESVHHATGEDQRAIINSSRKNEAAESKWKWYSIVDVAGGESKADAVKNNIAQEPWMLGPWIKVNWMWSCRRGQEWT